MNNITNVTKIKISKFFREGISQDNSDFWGLPNLKMNYYGDIPEIDFLNRLYDLNKIKSEDSRYDSAEGEIFQHRINNNDYDDAWIFEDSRFPLKSGDDQDFLQFLCELFNPEVSEDNYVRSHYLTEINKLLRIDGYELYASRFISSQPFYSWRSVTDSEKNHNGYLPFSIRYKDILKSKSLIIPTISRNLRKNIGEIIDTFNNAEDCAHPSLKNLILDNLSKYYIPRAYDDSGKYTTTNDIMHFIEKTSKSSLFDYIELFSKYCDYNFQFEINKTLCSLGYNLLDNKIMKLQNAPVTYIPVDDDHTLNGLMQKAIDLYRSDNIQPALEKVWDAMERVKTCFNPNDKKDSVDKLVRRISANEDSSIFTIIDEEFKKLTQIGNKYCIRHFEKDKIVISDTNIKEYLFIRCYSLVKLAIETINKQEKFDS